MGNSKDIAAGLLFVAIGGWFVLTALFRLRLGSALSMGPGYFPVILGSLLAGLGLAIGLAGLRRSPEALGPVPWRGLGLVIGAIVFFAAAVRGLGFAPALTVAALLASRAGGLGWRGALAVAVALTLLSVLVFVEALGLPYRLLGPWLRF